MYAAKVSHRTHHMIHSEEAVPEHRTGLGFSLRELTAAIPAALLIYRATEGGEILFANEEMISLSGFCDYAALMQFSKGSVKGLVRPDDNKEETSASGGYRSGSCRVLSKQGPDTVSERNAALYTRRVTTDHYGEVCYAIFHEER